MYSSLISFLVAAEVVNDLVVNGPNLEKPIVFVAFAGGVRFSRVEEDDGGVSRVGGCGS